MNNKSENYKISFADALAKLDWGIRGRRPLPVKQDSTAIYAARNEVTGLQVHIDADHEFVLLVDQANWLHPLGFLPRLRIAVDLPGFPGDSIEVFPIGYVDGDDQRSWMEYFDRAGYAQVPAARTQAVYIRLRIPGQQAPRVYQGSVRAFTQFGFEDERFIWEGQFQVEVMNVTLPQARDFKVHLNLWQHCTSIARFYHVPLWSDAHFELIDRYYACLAELGQKVTTVIAGEIPWSGQSCFRVQGYPSYMYEHSIIQVSRDPLGRLSFDYTALDRLLSLASKHGIDRQIDVFGLLNVWIDEEYGFGKVIADAPDAVRIRCVDMTSGAITYLRTAAELRQYLRALHDHFKAMGVIDRVRIAADEPADLDAFRSRLAFVREAAPEFQYQAALNHYEFIEDAPDGVIDFAPILRVAVKDLDLTFQRIEQVHKKGGKMLFYVCCGPPFPNTFVHSPLVETLLLGWMIYALRMDGFLRWAFCLWPAEPWKRISWKAPDFPAGDLYFVLPGLDGRPVETLRYEALRMAVQDYELLRMADQVLPPGQAREIFEQCMSQVLEN